MPRKKVYFIATKYKSKPMRVAFYTKSGEKVAFEAVKKVRTKDGVSFYTSGNRAARRK